MPYSCFVASHSNHLLFHNCPFCDWVRTSLGPTRSRSLLLLRENEGSYILCLADEMSLVADTVVSAHSGSVGVAGTVADVAADASFSLVVVPLVDDRKSGPSTY